MTPIGPIALSLFILGGQGVDVLSTREALARCPSCREANPLMRDQRVMLSVKGAVVAGASVGVFALWKRGKKAEAVALAATVGGIGFAMAAHNRGVGR